MGAWMLYAFVISMFVVVMVSQVDQASVQRACGSAGVAQIVQSVFGSLEGNLTVVCRDGKIHKVG